MEGLAPTNTEVSTGLIIQNQNSTRTLNGGYSGGDGCLSSRSPCRATLLIAPAAIAYGPLPLMGGAHGPRMERDVIIVNQAEKIDELFRNAARGVHTFREERRALSRHLASDEIVELVVSGSHAPLGWGTTPWSVAVVTSRQFMWINHTDVTTYQYQDMGAISHGVNRWFQFDPGARIHISSKSGQGIFQMLMMRPEDGEKLLAALRTKTQSAQSASARDQVDTLTALERLTVLRQNGSISDEEFRALKKKLMG